MGDRCEETMWRPGDKADGRSHHCRLRARFLMIRNGRELRLCGVHVLVRRRWDRKAGVESAVFEIDSGDLMPEITQQTFEERYPVVAECPECGSPEGYQSFDVWICRACGAWPYIGPLERKETHGN